MLCVLSNYSVILHLFLPMWLNPHLRSQILYASLSVHMCVYVCVCVLDYTNDSAKQNFPFWTMFLVIALVSKLVCVALLSV